MQIVTAYVGYLTSRMQRPKQLQPRALLQKKLK